MTNSPNCESAVLDSLVADVLDEYRERLNRGERPSVEEYVERHPEAAALLRNVLATIELLDLSLSKAADNLDERVTGTLGDFRLIREVGRGGMGIVYEAEQISLRRRVALKMLPWAAAMDPKQLQRFKNEALAAASLKHDHIVSVYAVGCERGVHYYAMEFIEGQTLAQLIGASRERKLPENATGDYPPGADAPGSPNGDTAPVAALSTERTGPRGREFYRHAAELIADAADALEHAHSLGIVHRDIKPGNFLLDANGRIYVSDFGLARFGPDAGLTMSGDLVGTLRYMAPEQALARHGLADHRVDVYGLGCTLYELLTGRPAVEGQDKADIVRRIAFEEPIGLRKLDKVIPAELETITLKCLAKNPNERYATAVEVAEDLRRWLSHHAIKAKPPGVRERVAKWGRRHKYLMRSAIAVLGVMVGAVIVSSLLVWQERNATYAQFVRAVAAEGETRARADDLKLVSEFQAGMLEQINPAEAGWLLTADVNAKFAEVLAKEGISDPERARLVEAFTANWRKVNATDAARKLIDRTILSPAVKAIDAQFANQPIVDAQLRQVLAERYRMLGLYTAALPLQEQALATRRRLLGEEHPDTLSSMHYLAGLYWSRSQYSKAESLGVQVLEVRRRVLGEEHPDTLTSMQNLAGVYESMAQYSKAEPLAVQVLELRRRVLGNEHSATLESQNSLGLLYQVMGQHPKAEPLLVSGLEVSGRVLGEFHHVTQSFMNNLGMLYQTVGQFPKAEPLAQKTLEISRRMRGEDHPITLRCQSNLAALYSAQGHYGKAAPLYEQILVTRRRLLGDEHADTLRTMNNLVTHYGKLAKYDKAEPLAVKALDVRRRVLGDEHPDTLKSMLSLAGVYQGLGKYPAAESLFVKTLEIQRRVLGDEHPNTPAFMTILASLYLSQGQVSKAKSLLVETLDIYHRSSVEDSPGMLHTLDLLSGVYQGRGQYPEAEPLFVRALELRRRTLGNEHPDTLRTMNDLGVLYGKHGQHAKAEPLLIEALEVRGRVRGEQHPDTLTSMNNLAMLFREQGQLPKAEALFVKALEGRRRVLGDEHLDTLLTMNNLAGAYWSVKKLDLSVPLFEEALKKYLATAGPEHPDTLRVMANLGVNYRAAGRVPEGMGLLEKAWETARKRSGPLDASLAWVPSSLAVAYDQADQFAKSEPLYRFAVDTARQRDGDASMPVAGALASLGLNLLKQQKYADAEPHLRECVTIREQKGPDDWTTFNTKSMLGGSLLGQKKYAEAKPLLVSGYEGMKQREDKIPPPAVIRMTEAIERLVQLYEETGETEKAAEWRKKLPAKKQTQAS